MAEQLLNGRYRLLRLLGTGGMASVSLAEDLRLGRHVAVKVLHPQCAADPSFVTRFAHEARIAAGLVHPNIVQVYDVGHDSDRHYIVMEYVAGETLKDLIRRQGALPVARALAIITGVLAALALAHAHNLIHRDITAQNILLTSAGDVKVADFGIAHDLSSTAAPTVTPAGMVLGTVHYFAPEQAQGRPAVPQSDVYAAGIVLYEMLTGTLPFDAANPLAVAMQQINQAPTPPRSLNPAIPPSVEAIVLKALAKNPAERFACAAEMKAAVDAARSGAAQPTRAVAVAPTAPMPPLAPRGAPRAGTRSPVQATARKTSAGRTPRRALWLTGAPLAIAAAVLLGYYVSGGTVLGFGGGVSATPRPSVTAQPTATSAPPTTTETPATPQTIFSNSFDSQMVGPLVVGAGPHQFSGTQGGLRLAVEKTLAASAPNALAVAVGGGGRAYAFTQYRRAYTRYDLTFSLWLNGDFALGGSSDYLILAQTVPSAVSNVGKVNVILTPSRTLRLDYFDHAGTQHYLWGQGLALPRSTWHTLELRETVGAGSGSLTLLGDGSVVTSGRHLDLGTRGLTRCAVGDRYTPSDSGTAGHLYIDDITATALRGP